MNTQASQSNCLIGSRGFLCPNLFLLTLLILIPLLSFSQPDKEKDHKILICHKGSTIEIGESALQAHLNHGDFVGPCEKPVVYEGGIAPYMPQIEKVEEPLGYELTVLYEVYQQTGSAASNDIYTVKGGSEVLIDIIAVEGKTADILAYLSATYGITEYIDNVYNLNPLVISVYFPIEKLIDFNSEPWISQSQFVRPVFRPLTNSGIVTSQGDFSQHSDISRMAYDLDGEGIKIGVLSDSYNSLGRNAAITDIKNGDLPGPENPEGHTTPIDVLLDYDVQDASLSHISDEGRAILQIIHDVAPASTLAFRTGFKTAVDMADGIYALKDAGCNIIIDDITYTTEPFFRDGVIAQAVNSATDEGVSYFTSAGNFGDHSYTSQFYPYSSDPSYHDFSMGVAGDTAQQVVLEPGYYRIVLQWEDDWYSLGDTENGGAQNDLDLLLYDDQNNVLIENNSRNVYGDPIETIYFKVENGTAAPHIIIHRASGNDNLKFKYIIFQGNFVDFDEYKTGTSTITGHANAEGAITIGAILYSNTPAYDTIAAIASFSSHGGTPVWDDNQMQEVVREKPDLIAPNGVNTTVPFGSLNIDGDDHPNFFGTSAAAPHAAAVAALLLEAETVYGEEVDVRDVLQSTAYTLGGSIFDFINGYGFIQAHSALNSMAAPTPRISKLAVPDGITPGSEAFQVTVIGEYLTETTQIHLNGVAVNTFYVDSSKVQADIPTFTDDPPLVAYTPPRTVNQTDGGFSEPFYFSDTPKSLVIIKADNKRKKYGEILPDFTATILVDSIPITEAGLTLTDLGLENMTFSTSASSTTIAGITCYIRPEVDLSSIDSAILEQYEYKLVDGNLTIEKLPLTITPNDLAVTYGDKIENITFHYGFDSTNMDLNEVEYFLEQLSQDHRSSFTGEDSIAIIDKGRLLVNKGRLLVNNLGYSATDDLLYNKGRLLVNGNVAIDLDTSLLFDYYENPDVTLTNKGRLLVNGKSLADGTAITDKGRLLVNNGGLVNSEDSTDQFANIVVIVDEADSAISTIYSLNLISGYDVIAGDSTHFIVPGAFLSPASENFEITYAVANLYILPAPLNVTVENKTIFLGDPMPKFTPTFTGFKFNENERTVFERINYAPVDINQIGIQDIMPEFEWIEPINYVLNPDPVIPGILTVRNLVNGKIALSAENSIGDYDLTLINSNGADPTPITSLLGQVHDPVFSPDGQEIVFTWRDNEYLSDLWKINSDSTGLTRLSASGNSGQATYSTDGTQIVYIQDGDIAITSMKGVNPEIIIETPENERWPFYSLDDTEIYFARDLADGINEIFKLNIGPGLSTMISWWPGDGFNRDIIGDYDGILQGGTTYGPGKVNEAFLLDGVDDFVMIPDSPGLNFGKFDFTIALWVNFVSTDGEQVIVEKWIQDFDGLSMGWTLTKLEGNVLRFAMQDGIDPEVILDVTPSSIPLNTWNHVTISREVNTFTMYWNGNFMDSLNCSYNLNSTSSLKLGHRGNPFDTPGADDDRGFYLNGSIDEVKIFDRALDTTEIESLVLPVETQITSDNIFYRKPRLFRDGSKILTTRADNSSLPSYEIVIMDTDGSNQTSLYTGTVMSATASPDGSKIAFINDNAGTGVLYEMDSTGSNVQEIYSAVPLDVQEADWGTYPDSYVNIPDPNFEQALIDLGIDSDEKLNGQILRGDAEAVTFLDISDPPNNPDLPNVNEKILELTGIEAFENLTELDCKFNQLTNLNFSNILRLTHLSCEENLLTSLDISNNKVLEYLDCGENLLTELDITQNTRLSVLICSFNQLTTIDVSQNTELVDFTCWNNQLTGLDLSQNTNLVYLNCNDNQMTSLDITQNPLLKHFQCYTNQLSSLDVTQNTLLEHLDCGANQLTELDVSQNTQLSYFECGYNQLSSLNVSQNTALQLLICDNNQLTSLDVTQNPLITILNCGHNQIDSLDLSLNADLVNLHCGHNQLNSIDLSSNLALTDLTCYENQLTSLDVSQNPALSTLSCDVNQITSLDVSQNPVLTYLYCSVNQLSSLDVRNGNNANFNTFVADANNLTCINVDDETADHTGWVVDLGVSFSNDCGIPVLVSIPDPNFEQALIDLGIDRLGILDGQISKYDAQVVDYLNISDPVNNSELPNVSAQISDLTGIEAFTNLKFLDCSYNVISSLDITQLTALIEISCIDNLLSELDVSQNPSLIGIYCHNNQITSLDVSHNPDLTHLSCYENPISVLDVTGNIYLEYLACPVMQLTELDVTQNTGLVYLNCDGNDLVSLDVSHNTALTTLRCHDNQLTGLDVTQNTELTELGCHSNVLTSLDVSQNTALASLVCHNNQLSSLEVSNNTSLDSLACDFNQLTSLDVSQNPSLTIINCSFNQLVNLDARNGNNANFTSFVADANNLTCISVDDELADHSDWIVDSGVIFSNDCDMLNNVFIPDPNFEQALIDQGIDSDSLLNQMILKADAEAVTDLYVTGRNISDLTGIEAFVNLTSLFCYENQLTEIDISHNTALTAFSCHTNMLTSLDVSHNTALTSLVCRENQLELLDVSNNLLLEVLTMDYNNISSLDLSNNTSLLRLFCYSNQLTSLDVTNNPALTTLLCSQNQLTTIDISQNLLLESLSVGNNSLTELDVSHNTLLTALGCWSNQINFIDISNNLLLEGFNIFNNQITTLDVSNNTALTMLICDSNQLTELDLSNNTQIDQLYVSNNLLTNLDLSNLILLDNLRCNENNLTNLDVRNGNNLNISSFVADNNNLTCIDVDNATDDHSSWIVDPGVTFSNDCAFEAMKATAIGNGTAIIDGNVTIYPNPVIDWLTLEFTDESVVLGDVTINVYDDGGTIYPVTIIESVNIYGYEVDFNSEPSGTYYVQLYDGIEVRVFRIVK